MIIEKIKSAAITAQTRGPAILSRAVMRLGASTFKRSLLGQRYQQWNVHNYKMFLDVKDPGLSRGLILFGTREVDHKIMLEQIVKPGMTIYDIGGNIGYYPLMELKLLNGTGKLVAIEPVPGNVKLLNRNLELNGFKDIPVLQAAISNEAGTREFYLSAQSNLGTFHPEGSASDTLTGGSENVETLTVPMLVEKYGPPDLMRMDVEGHEVDVLNGMLEDIEAGKYAPMVIFETHITRYGPENDMAGTMQKLFDLGYKVPLLSSSSERGTGVLKSLGYKPGQRIATDGIHRTLFTDIKPEDAISIVTDTGGARTVLLSKTPL